ncbi:MAG: YdeI/OmpD-associated family protein [Ktedonobacterales bacterium]
MNQTNTLPTLAFAAQEDWEAWLDEHHTDTTGLWLKIAKRATGTPSVTYAEALESALCYGWIDGQKAAFDDAHWLQKFTPRRARSGWSRVNREKAMALIAAGKMRPAGLREVERAQADGRWEAAYESQRAITVPEDLQTALDAQPVAKAFFATLDSTNRYAVLYRIHTAKKPETRAARIQTFVEMLAQHRKIHP